VWNCSETIRERLSLQGEAFFMGVDPFIQKGGETAVDSIQVTFPDGSVKSYPRGVALTTVVADVGGRLAEAALAAQVNGKTVDLTSSLEEDSQVRILTFEDPEGREVYRHSAAHVMAQAVQELFPQAKVTIGPPTEEGFYYDFDVPQPFTPDDLERIEARMREIIAADQAFQRREVSREEAARIFREMQEPYKLEILEEIPPEEKVSLYCNDGGWCDLCRGPHLPSTGKLGEVKLLSVAGAYWRGDETRPMLQRIYGTAFPDRKQLQDYLHRLEEARRRDHRRLGRELDLFSVSEKVGPGLILWHPQGALVRYLAEQFCYREHLRNGYQLVYTPHIGKRSLWETSGHLDFFAENMYPGLEVEGQEYFLKPMNCPFHIQIYQSQTRSYRDLPLRLAEFGTVYRYERAGVLHGLARVRGFTQDDAHIFCRPDQVQDEINGVLDFTLHILRSFGLEEFKAYLATQPEKAVGDRADWERATEALRQAIEGHHLAYEVDEGGGAFYGPKIDVKIQDALGREWQCTTIQFDFNLAERFALEYIGPDGQPHRPYLVHRALLGSMERFLAILIEHYGGAFPVWLAPVQVMVLPVTERQLDYACQVRDRLRAAGLRAEVDGRDEKVRAKVAEAERRKVPLMLIVGPREVEAGTVSVRERGMKDRGVVSVDAVIEWVQTQ
jgi:threonyl-tRNA synthetase